MALAWLFAFPGAGPAFAESPGTGSEEWNASWRWRFDQSGRAPGATTALARAPSGRLASGGERGLTVRPPGATTRRIPLRGVVRDLAFDAGERLWVATTHGVFRLDPGAPAPRDESPSGGERARLASRVAAAGPEVAVATAAGVFWRRGGHPWQRIGGALGELPATALALVVRGSAPSTLWVANSRGLHRVQPSLDPVARGHPLPGTAGSIADLWPDDEALWVLTSRSLVDARAGDRSYRVGGVGESPRRLVRFGGVFFLATGRGLWTAAGPGGPWRRAADPAGTGAWSDLVVWSGGVALGGARGLLWGEREDATLVGREREEATPFVSEDASGTQGAGATAPPQPSAVPARPVAAIAVPEASPPAAICTPSVAAVHRAALEYLALRGDPVARMRRGVRRRGWLPQLRLQGRYISDRDRGRDGDESFVSGGLRRLHDWDHDRGRTREISLAATWELGDLAYHPEEIDISTEARRLIELRDDVLDEVNQLYFDRERALREGAPHDAERFAAGLDGWTEGWFSRAVEECASTPR